jgi:hypothetical protein
MVTPTIQELNYDEFVSWNITLINVNFYQHICQSYKSIPVGSRNASNSS